MRWFTTTASLTAALPLEWLTLSPAYPPYLVFTNFAGGSPRLFWIGSGFTLVYALIALLLAATVLQRTWREGPETLAKLGARSPSRPPGAGLSRNGRPAMAGRLGGCGQTVAGTRECLCQFHFPAPGCGLCWEPRLVHSQRHPPVGWAFSSF